jgi:cyclopropane fatty-acyl-phospholipid synthase-like methyltransferase
VHQTPDELFPLSNRYDRTWVDANSLGENTLHFAESLVEALPLKRGMRVLDLACGHAISSIFLAREFGVTVWAVDRAVDPTENFRRVKEMDCEDKVFPLRADARSLPFPHDYFDAVVVLDAFVYFGTDERFLPIFARHVKPGGHIGIVDACFSREIETADALPEHLRDAWYQGWSCVHTAEWWRRHWEKSGMLRNVRSERLPHSDFLKSDFIRRFQDDPDEKDVIAMMQAEGGSLVGSFRMVGERTDYRVQLEDDGTAREY